MLTIKDLHAYYGRSHILQGVNLHIEKGEIVSLLGRNGVGRSTTCKAIIGLVPGQGSILYQGREMIGLKPHTIARKGIGFVPEDRWIFPGLTVLQNLQLGMKKKNQEGRWSIENFFEMFPNLKARRDVHGGLISGGEKQMLTICRTLMGDPDFIMIDEPTEGLAPMLVEQMGHLIEEIARRGISVLLVEQKLSIALKISQRLYIMGHGRIVFEGTPEDLRTNQSIRKEWLEV
ncbi:MAG TPA: ABC transporter ATP-binding protein [Thermodesulfobacteriota bacterium]|nr:ABC transporter ATP-binding protein [Thermodesulfobacteriota bacterium]